MTTRAGQCARAVAFLQALMMVAGCGGSSSSSSSTTPGNTPVANTVSVSIDGGPVPTENLFNALYTSVEICVPGSTTECQTIGGIEVDTGSSGLRLLSSAVSLSLPKVTGPTGNPLAECLQFSDSSTWGAVKKVDLKLAGELAGGVPVQVIGDTSAGPVPTACTKGGFPSTNDQASLGANGVLGVGNFLQDCGPACEVSGSANPGLYYECASPTSCSITAVSLAEQVSNPVASFASDNNGVVVQLPAVAGHAVSLTGSLIFGIGTQADNSLGAAKIFTLNGQGYLGTQYKGKSLPYSFVDSGSSGISFPDTSIPTCKDYSDLFCPKQDVKLSAILTSPGGVSSTIPFTVGNADTLFAQFPSDSVFATVCSPAIVTDATAPNGPNSFDWGLTFFYGRTVFTAIEGRGTPGGAGPYVAF
ncbi:MAG: DUF3443 family protein [Vicinamibacteria bacterium]